MKRGRGFRRAIASGEVDTGDQHKLKACSQIVCECALNVSLDGSEPNCSLFLILFVDNMSPSAIQDRVDANLGRSDILMASAARILIESDLKFGVRVILA